MTVDQLIEQIEWKWGIQMPKREPMENPFHQPTPDKEWPTQPVQPPGTYKNYVPDRPYPQPATAPKPKPPIGGGTTQS